MMQSSFDTNIPRGFNRVEVDLAALTENYLAIRRRVGKGVEVMAMVKADAYGHGLVAAATTLVRAGARTFGVAEVEEGRILRQAGIDGEIIVLLGVPREELTAVIEHRLQPVIFDLATAAALSAAACRVQARVRVHLKVDVGMGRLGILPEAVAPFLEKMAELPGLHLAGILSHFPMADRPRTPETQEQLRRFTCLLNQFRGSGAVAHIANSAALLSLPDAHLDLVRPGIALYGCQPGIGLGQPLDLRPVMSFKSRVVQIKDVPAGYGLSYGHTYVTNRPSRMAVLPVGYDDGYLRRLSNRAEVLIRGQRVPLRGTICMNACVADVTELPEVAVGDEVVLLGRQGGARVTADELAVWSDTIHYEILCLFGGRNARTYLPVNS